MSSRYARDTSVTVRRSQAELGDILERYGARRQMFGTDDDTGTAMIAFQIDDKSVRMQLPLPAKHEFALTDAGRARSAESQRTAWEQACRSRWRVLVLVVKAKLEAVECGISTIEREFLPDLMLPSGRTVGEEIMPEITEFYVSGRAPQLLLGSG